MKLLAPNTLLLATLTACGAPTPVHRGLAPDGYGTTSNSPHLAPPDHLMAPATSQPAAANAPTVAPAATP